MRKLLVSTAVLLSTAMVTPAFAHGSFFALNNSSVAAGTNVTTSADLACYSAALTVRENAVISARTTLNASILTALTNRRNALVAAFTISNNTDRQVAINAAMTAYVNAVAAAHATYKTSVKAANTTFTSATVNCRHNGSGSYGVNAPGFRLWKNHDHEMDDDDDDDRGNNGRHLGWFKNKSNGKHKGHR